MAKTTAKKSTKPAGVKAAAGLLPPPKDLERICKGIATLDAIVCDDWEMRYYSFQQAWDATSGQRMASMRNGSGDEWFIVFAPEGVFLKAFWHEYPRATPANVYEGIPRALAPQLREAAFSMDYVTFGGWHDGIAWTLRGNDKPLVDELAILNGDPKYYRAYASDYFQVQLHAPDIAHVLAGKKLDARLVKRVSQDERTLPELKSDLAGIGY